MSDEPHANASAGHERSKSVTTTARRATRPISRSSATTPGSIEVVRRQRAEHEVERLRGERQRAAIALDQTECRRHTRVYVKPSRRRLDDAGAGVYADRPALVPACGSPREKGGREVGAAGANIEQRDAAVRRGRVQARLQVASDQRPAPNQ